MNNPGRVRVRRFADGAYAVSVADRRTGRYSLVEGRDDRARVVVVTADGWTEGTAGDELVPSGIARASAQYRGRPDGGIEREFLTTYPNGTHRVDEAVRERGAASGIT